VFDNYGTTPKNVIWNSTTSELFCVAVDASGTGSFNITPATIYTVNEPGTYIVSATTTTNNSPTGGAGGYAICSFVYDNLGFLDSTGAISNVTSLGGFAVNAVGSNLQISISASLGPTVLKWRVQNQLC
jgi:hypothetical protein